MRKQTFAWTFLVLAIVLTAYGGYAVINSVIKQKDIPILGLIFLIVGSAMLVLFLVLLIISLFQRKKKPAIEEVVEQEEIKEEPAPVAETKEEEPVVSEKPVERTYRNDVTYERRSSPSRSYGGSAYIKRVGYGPVLRVEEDEILDMRSNTYYRIEGNYVKQSGSGPVFEISGNSIKLAYGGYLYEISGGNVNKTYGGYFASISGGYLQTHDLSEKYEISGSLTLKQQLAVVAILFGTY